MVDTMLLNEYLYSQAVALFYALAKLLCIYSYITKLVSQTFIDLLVRISIVTF